MSDQFQPFEITRYRHDGVEQVEPSGRVEPLVEVESRTDRIHHDPHQPLFGVFAREHPQGGHAGGGGEAVAVGYRAVRVADQQYGRRSEAERGDEAQRQQEAARHAGDGQRSVVVPPAGPCGPAVDAGDQVVDVDGHVGVEARCAVDENVEGGHDDADRPQPDAGAVFEPEVEQSGGYAGDLEQFHGGGCGALVPDAQRYANRWVSRPEVVVFRRSVSI